VVNNNTASVANQTVGIVGQTYTLTSIRAAVSSAPGTGVTWQIELWSGSSVATLAATGLKATIADLATTGSGTGSVTVNAGDFIAVVVTRTVGTAATRQWVWTIS
jgi:hypothetical protein